MEQFERSYQDAKPGLWLQQQQACGSDVFLDSWHTRALEMLTIYFPPTHKRACFHPIFLLFELGIFSLSPPSDIRFTMLGLLNAQVSCRVLARISNRRVTKCWTIESSPTSFRAEIQSLHEYISDEEGRHVTIYYLSITYSIIYSHSL